MRASELVELAMQAQGIDPGEKAPYAKLAERLGFRDYPPQKVRRWHKGENEPDYTGTLLLLEIAGLLRSDAASKGPFDAAVDAPEELLALAVAEAEELARTLRRLAAQEPPPQIVPGEGRE